MRKWISFLNKNKDQFLIYAIIFIAVILCTVLVRTRNRNIFTTHLGTVNPLVSITIISMVGFVCFNILIKKDWFAVFQAENRGGYGIAAILSIVFCFEAIVLDLVFRFPKDMNILFPNSILYYPIVGFVVNILFHVIIVTIVMGLLWLIAPHVKVEKTIWIAILLTALVEPVYQMIFGVKANGWTWLVVLTGIHVMLINLAQLFLFRRYDFVSIYAMRLMFYLLWHIVWGMVRLNVLF